MVKHTDNHMEFKNFEEEANKFISSTFDYCEDELRKIRVHHSLPNPPKYQALPHAAMSVQQSIMAFLAILQIPNE